MKAMRMILKCGTIFCILTIMFSGTVQAHTPSFSWKILGGVVNPEQWIFDGTVPVAMFEQRFIEQPGENLLFFDGVPKPPLLRHLKLTPDGEPLVEGVQLYWTLIHRNIITDRLIDLDIEGNAIAETLPIFTENSATTVAGSKAFKKVTSVTIPAHDGTAATTAIGFGDILGLSRKLSRNSGEKGWLAETIEGTAPTFTVSAADIESNTVDLNSALNGTQVIVEYTDTD